MTYAIYHMSNDGRRKIRTKQQSFATINDALHAFDNVHMFERDLLNDAADLVCDNGDVYSIERDS